jgi:soluble lytic murein transglycosylase-like protein
VGWWKEASLLVGASAAVVVLLTHGAVSETSAATVTATTMDRSSSTDAAQAPSAGYIPESNAPASWTHGIVLGRLVQSVASGVGNSARPVAANHPAPAATPAIASASATQASVATPADAEPSPVPVATTLGSGVPDNVRRWEPLIVKYAAANDLDPNLVAAVIMTESGGNPSATSSKGAIGLMQVVNGPYDPESNIRDGTRILAAALNKYGGDLELSLAAYNAGSGAVARYGGIPPYSETQTYVFVVLNRYYLFSTT